MKIKLTNVRIAFCQNLFTAGTMAGAADSKPAFSSTFLIPKDDPQLAKIKEAIKLVAKEKWQDKADTMLKSLSAEGKLCLKDGETKSQYQGFEGCMFIPTRSYVAPKVFDKDKSELSEKSGKVYAGCYVNASVDIWAQQNAYGKRVNATLKGVQFVKDGDAFAASAPASEADFDDLSEGVDDFV